MTDFLTISKPLIERGFSVIPIEPNGKRPVQGAGATKRTRHLSDLKYWADLHPDANVAICADVNIVILETDDFDRLRAAVKNGTGNDIPPTLMSCGSSENRPHLFFHRTERATNVGNLVVPGLFEARFNNQYVVAAGSVHPSGAVYRWISDVPVAPVPDWLVSELARLALSQKTNTTDNRRIESANGRVPEGSRHYFLMRELGRLWDGKISEAALEAKAIELNAQCDPPKDSSHVLQCVRDIMRREPFDPGPTVVLGSAEKKTEDDNVDWPVVTARSFRAKAIPPRQSVVKEGEATLFYESSVNQVVAWRGVGKTNFAMKMAEMMATGGTMLNFNAPVPRKVLYLDGELPEAQFQERINSLITNGNDGNIYLINPEFLEPKRSINLLSPPDEAALFRLIERAGIEVVFIDSQSTAMKGDSLESSFQEGHLGLLMRLRWKGLCVIEMHHAGKGGLQRGSSRNDDILDVQMHLKKMDGWEPENGLEFELEYLKVRHAAALESGYIVTLVDGVWCKRPSDDLAAAAELFNKELGVREVAKKLKISTGKAGNLRKKALKLGLVNSAVEINIAGVKSGKGAR